MTNGEWIRSLSNEELIKEMNCFDNYCEYIQKNLKAVDCKRTQWAFDLSPCDLCKLSWLEKERQE